MKTSNKLLLGFLIVCVISVLYLILNVKYIINKGNGNSFDIKANYNNISREYKPEHFNRVILKNNIRSSYKPSSESKIIIHTDEDIMDMFQYEVENGELLLSTKKNNIRGVIDVEIYTDSLTGITLFQGSRMETDSFCVSSCIVKLQEASNFNGFINTKDLVVKSKGTSTATIEGFSENLVADIEERGILFATNLTVNNAKINLSKMSNATLLVKEKMSVDIQKGCELKYFGSPLMENVNIEKGARIVKEGEKDF